jgi:outer membrane lipoprotein
MRSVPDAIKGTSPTPQQDLVRVMNAPQLYVGQEARFGGKVSVQNQQGKPAWKSPPFRWTARAAVLGEASRGRIYADVNGFLDPVDFRGQLVTVVGPITGVVDGKVGSTPYKFMLMNATGYKRWRRHSRWSCRRSRWIRGCGVRARGVTVTAAGAGITRPWKSETL